MLGYLVAIVAAFSVRRLWPDAVIFLSAWPAVAVIVQLLMISSARAQIGETVDWSARTLLPAYILCSAINGIVFFVAYGFRRFREKRRVSGR